MNENDSPIWDMSPRGTDEPLTKFWICRWLIFNVYTATFEHGSDSWMCLFNGTIDEILGKAVSHDVGFLTILWRCHDPSLQAFHHEAVWYFDRTVVFVSNSNV